jgi:hypothetical protein
VHRSIAIATAIAIFTVAAALGCAHQRPSAAPPDQQEHQSTQPADGLQIPDPDAAHRIDDNTLFDVIEREVQDMAAGQNPAPDWAKEWAGVYDHPGIGSTILIGPTHAAEVFGGHFGAPAGLLGLISDGSQDGVTIRWQIGNEKLSSPLKLYFVRWKGERYLADGQSITEMLNTFNRNGRVEFEWRKRRVPDPRPELPDAFTRGMHKGRIIIDVKFIDFSRTEDDPWDPECKLAMIELQSGSADGLYVGMDLPCTVVPAGAEPPPPPQMDDPSTREPRTAIVIDHVEEHRSTGRFRFPFKEGQPPPPRAGDRLVTYRYE